MRCCPQEDCNLVWDLKHICMCLSRARRKVGPKLCMSQGDEGCFAAGSFVQEEREHLL